MPTLNYENTGALVGYDYLQGTITALNTDDDTADVSGVCGSLSAVPIFYHCEPSSAARDNGALVGAASGFKVGDLVVVLKAIGQASSSLYSLEKIELKSAESTATGPKYFVVGHYDEVRKCVGNEFIFISINAFNVVEFYRYDHSKPDIAPVLWKTLDVKAALPVAVDPVYISYLVDYPVAMANLLNVDLMYAEGDINALMVRSVVWDWRGNTVWYDPTHYAPPGVPHWNALVQSVFPIKIPIDFYGNTKISADIVGQLGASIPNKTVMTQSGLLQFISQDGVFRSYDAQPINEFQGGAPWITLGNTVQVSRNFYAMGAQGDYLVIVWDAVQNGDPAVFVGGYISLYNTPFWQGEEPIYQIEAGSESGYFNSYLRNAAQVLINDDRIYVFFDTRNYSDIQDISVAVYDMELAVIQERTTVTGITGNRLSRVSIVNDGVDDFICFRTLTILYTDGYPIGFDNPVYLINIETLNVVKTITLPASKGVSTPIDGHYGYYGTSSAFTAVSAPKTTYLLDKINEYRFEQPGYYQGVTGLEPYTMPVSYLGYSRRLEQCARLHANWLVSQGRMRHQDANGKLVHDRGVVFGYRRLATGENLACIDVTVFTSANAQVDECLRIWKESPSHNLNLVNKDLTCMGCAAATYPASVHSIILGDGAYNPQTHSYSTGESTMVLDPSQYGNMKLFVYTASVG